MIQNVGRYLQGRETSCNFSRTDHDRIGLFGAIMLYKQESRSLDWSYYTWKSEYYVRQP